MTGIAMERQTGAAPGYSSASDEELVARVQAGETAAYDEIVNRYKDRVFSYACRMLGDPESANETAQDVFLRAYRHLGRFRGDAKFGTWFYTIVSSTCKNAYAYNARRARHAEPRAATGEDGPIFEALDRAPDATFAPHLIVSRRDVARIVRDAIDGLPEPYKSTIVMRDVNNMSYEDISRVMNCRLGTVKSRLARARLMMREKLAGTGVLDPECD